MNMSFLNYCALNLMPGWGPILNAPVPERIEQLRDLADPADDGRARANSDEAGMFRRLADFPGYVIGDTFSAANEGWPDESCATSQPSAATTIRSTP